MAKRTIEQVDVAGRRVLMRVDFNVPLDGAGAVTDDRRISLTLKSIESIVGRGGRLILISHLGRPRGAGYEAALSLKPAADRLGELLPQRAVRFVGDDCLSEAAARAVASLADGEILILENLRFHSGEKKGDAGFAGALAAYGDIYCHEAFATAHRSDASLVALPAAMGDCPKVAGVLLEKELRYLTEAIAGGRSAGGRFVALLGGAKVADKLGAIENLMGRVDTILLGGAMAYTFLKALGQEIGSSRLEAPLIQAAQAALDAAAASPTDLILPKDHVCGKQITRMTPVRVSAGSVPPGWMGLDIGPESAAQYVGILREAKTVVWNGPVGVVETPPFDVGTKLVAEAIAHATDAGAVSVVGGGDTAAAVAAFGLVERFSHVSTGGGVSLQMLQGRRLASIDALDEVPQPSSAG